MHDDAVPAPKRMVDIRHGEGNFGHLAGLKRLGLAHAATAILSVEQFLPAVGQGAIAIETRAADARVRDLVAAVDHGETSAALTTERAFLAVLDGSCRTPIAGHATIAAQALQFRGLILRPDGSEAHETACGGSRDDAAALGAEAGRELKRLASPDFFAPG